VHIGTRGKRTTGQPHALDAHVLRTLVTWKRERRQGSVTSSGGWGRHVLGNELGDLGVTEGVELSEEG